MARLKRVPITEKQIDRRIEFLIKEAQSADCIRDQTVTYALRVITNFLAVEDDVSASAMLQRSTFRSEEAHNRLARSPDTWAKEVTNEHWFPLKRAWSWILDQRGSLNVKDVKEHLRRWPIVVVTKKENSRLRDDDAIGLEQRYRNAKIKVLRKIDERWEVFFDPKSEATGARFTD